MLTDGASWPAITRGGLDEIGRPRAGGEADVGESQSPRFFCKPFAPGDEIVCEIEGLGQQRTTMVAAG